jgi:hypothetical protein
MRHLNRASLRDHTRTVTHQGAAAYTYGESDPLTHLTFSLGAALFTEGAYQTAPEVIRDFAVALVRAARVEPRFPWQYAAWMRDPKGGKGNRVQGSLAPALLDALLDDVGSDGAPFTEDYVARCLSHRADDAAAFITHYEVLGLGRPSGAARRGVARALVAFDEYQLLKYAGRRDAVRLCDVIALVRPELEALGPPAELAQRVGRYLHAPTRGRAALTEGLPLTAARRALWAHKKSWAESKDFRAAVAAARVTWEQVVSHFGTRIETLEGRQRRLAVRRNHAVWRALLAQPNLLGDLALLRNLRNLHAAGFSDELLKAELRDRRFEGVWPQQVYAGAAAVPELMEVFEVAFRATARILPPGRHLGIGDASGSMGVKVGGDRATLTAMDCAFALVGLMSETSGLGASFSDDAFRTWSGGEYLSLVKRRKNQGPLAFARSRPLRRGMGGTQVHGAVVSLIEQLRSQPGIERPDCLWFFSDMQFHPAAAGKLPGWATREARRLGLDLSGPPLETALALYRALLGPVDVVLWNLAAYAPVPVAADFEGVLLVSGFDANTLKTVARWRAGGGAQARPVRDNQRVLLDEIRTY